MSARSSARTLEGGDLAAPLDASRAPSAVDRWHSGLVPFHVRPARSTDADFLTEMLVMAAFWRPDGPTGSVQAVLERPEFAHYVSGWPRPGDLGVVAEGKEGPVGAAWLRLLPEDDPGYGFVDAATPELSIGVAPPQRGQGVGSSLLEALVASAREQARSAVSLSVEPDNPARHLYERFGFQVVSAVNGSVTMLLHI